ncbi:MAG: UDP-glucose--hexose-1-phosphate uridylyltransferase [Clostridia bacterium]|nr:UDP-glucose--hexose-1-phosphate uridylyltransferase [Clostridia bacterium]MBQ2940948.1 UDP-glucose--hexose-1-phosphate uridylyltransferase [Clostridia bacterium]
MIYEAIDKLVSYGVLTGLIDDADRFYVRNRLLTKLHLDSYEETGAECSGAEELDEILTAITDYAAENGMLENNSVVYRDIFDTEIMETLTPFPSTVIQKFRELYQESPKAATDYFYKLSQDNNYIRRGRIQKDIKWLSESAYGEMEITINRSKPEKDPKAIAAAKLQKQSSYPKCQLCVENEGYGGRVNHPARQNHRIIPIDICGQKWGFQYSPYVYYNEHCIVFNQEHLPMVIDKSAFSKLLSFVKNFPHYIIGSNADLPIVGGSILSHEHFQGGNHRFAMQKAESEKFYTIPGFEDVSVSRVKWPMSVLRLKGSDEEQIVELSDRILKSWRAYTDESAFIYAETDGEPHNTITPIAAMENGEFVMDLVLRNNITTEEHPLGVYHPHAELHHIKKENIGLIEVMGLAVLPSRLVEELDAVADALVSGADMGLNEKTASHKDWAEAIKKAYPELNKENVQEILRAEVGKVFATVLEHAGVYRRDAEGMAAFDRFVEQI